MKKLLMMNTQRYVTRCLSAIGRRFSVGKLVRTATACAVAALLLVSCNKEDDGLPPLLALLSDSGLVYQDTELNPGAAFTVGLRADMGSQVITNLYIARFRQGEWEVMLDTGIHHEWFVYYRNLNKGVYPEEYWIFRVKDKGGRWAEVSFTLKNPAGSTYQPVRTIPSLVLGAQQCTTNGSFLDVNHARVYFQDSAFLVQDSIELLYYYDPAGDANTISSPNANIDPTIYTGASGLSNWTVKHECKFLETAISAATFDAVANDSLLIATFDAINAKRKAKNLVAGEVYSFKTAHGKFGLFKVNDVQGMESGTIDVTIKIQP